MEFFSPSYMSMPKEITIFWSDSNDPYLVKLRSKYNLEDLVRDCKTDYDKILTVTHWVHTIWEHDGSCHPPVSDPISILKLIEDGYTYACVEYATVLAGCLNSLGVRARVLSLKMADVETRLIGAGHVVVQAYIDNLNKWVMIDPQMDVIPKQKEKPLNAVELQKALAS